MVGSKASKASNYVRPCKQGCPREVRLLLAGLYYYDVDMVNSLPNVVSVVPQIKLQEGVHLQ